MLKTGGRRQFVSTLSFLTLFLQCNRLKTLHIVGTLPLRNTSQPSNTKKEHVQVANKHSIIPYQGQGNWKSHDISIRTTATCAHCPALERTLSSYDTTQCLCGCKITCHFGRGFLFCFLFYKFLLKYTITTWPSNPTFILHENKQALLRITKTTHNPMSSNWQWINQLWKAHAHWRR